MAVNREDVNDFKELIIPEGWYGMVIKRIEEKVSSKKCKMGVVDFQIIDDAPIGGDVDPDNDAEPKGTWQRAYVVTPDTEALDAGEITQKQYKGYGKVFKDFILACGYDDVNDILDDDDEVNWQELVSNKTEIECRVKHELIDKEDPDKGYRAQIAYGAFRAID